jgi:hypothetical protein
MKDLCRLIWSGFLGLLRSRSALAAENLVLRQQINVLRRTAPRRLSFNCLDRFVFVGLYRLFPDVRWLRFFGQRDKLRADRSKEA